MARTNSRNILYTVAQGGLTTEPLSQQNNIHYIDNVYGSLVDVGRSLQGTRDVYN